MYELSGHDGKVHKNLKSAIIPEPYYCSVYGWVKEKLFCVGYGDSSFQAMPKLFLLSGNDQWSIEIE